MSAMPALCHHCRTQCCAAWGHKFDERMSMSAPRDMENGTADMEKVPKLQT